MELVENTICTWQELRAFASGLKMDAAALLALQLATFVQLHAAPSWAYNSFLWLVENLKPTYDVSLVTQPAKRVAPSRFGAGARQAPVSHRWRSTRLVWGEARMAVLSFASWWFSCPVELMYIGVLGPIVGGCGHGFG